MAALVCRDEVFGGGFSGVGDVGVNVVRPGNCRTDCCWSLHLREWRMIADLWAVYHQFRRRNHQLRTGCRDWEIRDDLTVLACDLSLHFALVVRCFVRCQFAVLAGVWRVAV